MLRVPMKECIPMKWVPIKNYLFSTKRWVFGGAKESEQSTMKVRLSAENIEGQKRTKEKWARITDTFGHSREFFRQCVSPSYFPCPTWKVVSTEYSWRAVSTKYLSYQERWVQCNFPNWREYWVLSNMMCEKGGSRLGEQEVRMIGT